MPWGIKLAMYGFAWIPGRVADGVSKRSETRAPYTLGGLARVFRFLFGFRRWWRLMAGKSCEAMPGQQGF